MFPISSAATRLGDTGGQPDRTFQVEVRDADPASVESFAIEPAPKLGPGDKVYLRSGNSGVYRKVARVEPIEGGGALIWLESGHILRREKGQMNDLTRSI